MTRRPNGTQVAPELVVEQLRQMLAQYEPVHPAPPRYEPLDGEPAPWSVPPPGGFDELRNQLRKAG